VNLAAGAELAEPCAGAAPAVVSNADSTALPTCTRYWFPRSCNSSRQTNQQTRTQGSGRYSHTCLHASSKSSTARRADNLSRIRNAAATLSASGSSATSAAGAILAAAVRLSGAGLSGRVEPRSARMGADASRCPAKGVSCPAAVGACDDVGSAAVSAPSEAMLS
jgi:hypothetical protein